MVRINIAICLLGILPWAFLAHADCPGELSAYWDFESPQALISEPSLSSAAQVSNDVPDVLLENKFSLFFDGVDDVLEIPDEDILSFDSPQAQFSLSCWLKPTKLQNADFLGKYDSTRGQKEYAWRIFETGEMDIAVFDARSGTVGTWRTAAAGITPGEWQHIAVTVDVPGQHVQFFINGEQVPSAIASGPFPKQMGNFAAPLRFGAVRCSQGDLCGHFQGGLDEVRFYRWILSPEEVRSLSRGDGVGCRSDQK